jgi:hypothetical protein
VQAVSSNVALNDRDAADTLWVYDNGTKGTEILDFPYGASGAAAPTSSVLIEDGLPASITVDSRGRIYVVTLDASASSLLVIYEPGLKSRIPVAWLAKEAGPIALDAQQHIWVANSNTRSIVEYPALPANAYGRVKLKPLRIISGSRTLFYFMRSVALDGAGHVYVSQNGSSKTNYAILGFPTTASGNVAPVIKLVGKAVPYGGVIAFNSRHQLVAQTNENVEIFAAGANGKAQPVLTRTWRPYQRPWGMTVDRADIIYVATSAEKEHFGHTSWQSSVFALLPDGKTTRLTGTRTGLEMISGVAIGPHVTFTPTPKPSPSPTPTVTPGPTATPTAAPTGTPTP